jgi:hypothetical protein
MEDFDRNGCKALRQEFYDELNSRYGMFSDTLDLYKKAAGEVLLDEDLSRFLAILCRGLEDREFHKEDMRNFAAPQKPGNLAYEMLTSLAIASEADACYALLSEQKLPQEQILRVMRMPELGVAHFQKRNDGRPGYSLLDWFQLAVDGKLFRIGRLEFELFHNFGGKVCVFEDDRGRRIKLADGLSVHKSGMALGSKCFESEEDSWSAELEETEICWKGYPLDHLGLAVRQQKVLPKERWHPVLRCGDPVISIHIPEEGRLQPEAVDEAISNAKEFVKKYYPNYSYKAFVCYSWLLDPQLENLLPQNSNIVKFSRRFEKVTMKSKGNGALDFVFRKTDPEIDISALPERTTLERALKALYLDGCVIHETAGYFFWE